MGGGPTVTLHVVDHIRSPAPRTKKYLNLIDNGGSAIFGRDPKCDLQLRPADPNNERADRSISRIAGEFVARGDDEYGDCSIVEVWNYSSTNWLIATGERGYTLNLAPRSRGILAHQNPVIWVEGQEANYGFYIDNPDADEEIYKKRYEEHASKLGIQESVRQQTLLATSAESLKGSFAPAHQLVLEAIFRDYLSPQPGVFPRPRSIREVREELAGLPVIRASYSKPLTDDNVASCLKTAIAAARKHKVPGMVQLDDSRNRRPADQAEWIRHRLAMFLLGAGVITRSDD